MAVLWHQRELLKQLDAQIVEHCRDAGYELTPKGKLSLKARKRAAKQLLVDENGFFIVENEFIIKLLESRGKGLEDFDDVHALQRLLNASIKDGFVTAIPNEDFDENYANSDDLLKDLDDYTKSSRRQIKVSDDKGTELLNGTYFWCKYIANVFPPITTIATAVVTTVLTSGAIWFFLLNFLKG